MDFRIFFKQQKCRVTTWESFPEIVNSKWVAGLLSSPKFILFASLNQLGELHKYNTQCFALPNSFGGHGAVMRPWNVL